MEFDFKKFFVFVFILCGAIVYIKSHYTPQDVLDYAKRNPNPKVSPALDYYVGMGYFSRSEFEPAKKAFTQLLTDYPTSQYSDNGFLRLGESYEALHDWAGAKESYEKYLELFPDGK